MSESNQKIEKQIQKVKLNKATKTRQKKLKQKKITAVIKKLKQLQFV